MSPEKRVLFSFLLNNALDKGQIRPEYLLHNTIGPCAQTRRIKDIGLVLRKYYGLGRAIASKLSIRQSITMDTLSGGGVAMGSRRVL